MRNRVSGALLAIALAAGCSNPPPEDPQYESRDVQPPPIDTVSGRFAGQTIAVIPFLEKTNREHRAQLGALAPDILVAYALDAGFQPVERDQIDAAVKEQLFGQTENVDPKTAASVGRVVGAKYVLIGAITNYEERKAKGSGGFSVPILFEQTKEDAYLIFEAQVSGRIVEVETGLVLAADPGTADSQKYLLEGGRVKVIGIGVDKGQQIEVKEGMGKVLKLSFARSMNKMVKQLNAKAHLPPPGGAPESGSTAPAKAGGTQPARRP